MSSTPTSTSVPMHGQVRAELVQRIEDGVWGPGASIPGEVELAGELGVSVGTVRRALDDLVHARILERRRRFGTTVTAHTQRSMRDHFFQVVRRTDGSKAFPMHEVIAFSTHEPDRTTEAALGRGLVHEIETVATLHGEVVLTDRIAISRELAPSLTRAVYTNKPSSAFALYQQLFGVTVLRASETLEAVGASITIARRLGIDRGAPVLEIRRTAYALNGSAVEFRRRWLRTGTHVYLSELGPARLT